MHKIAAKKLLRDTPLIPDNETMVHVKRNKNRQTDRQIERERELLISGKEPWIAGERALDFRERCPRFLQKCPRFLETSFWAMISL